LDIKIDPPGLFKIVPLFVVSLFVLTIVAFWPSYLTVAPSTLSIYHHLHAVTATAWLVLLFVQPLLAISGRIALHKSLGRLTYVLMPILLFSMVGLAHSIIQGKTETDLEIEVFLSYVRLVGSGTLALFYLLAIAYRHNTPVHARLMLCTALPLIEPVANRIGLRVLNDWSFNYQYLSMGIMAAILLSCIWAERRSRSARLVFPFALAGLFVAYLPLLLRFYKWGSTYDLWRQCVLWFASLPIP
jgi:hypothetical protein